MFNDRLNNREGIAPILLSMFLGLLVVLLLGGLLLNIIGNYRDSRGTRVETKQIEALQASETSSKEGLLSKLKKQFSKMTQQEEVLEKDAQSSKRNSVAIKKVTIKQETSPSNRKEGNVPIMPISAVQTSTFLRAVEISGISELSAEKGEVFTIFMPSNEAFSNSQTSLENLINKGDQKALQLFIKRHIVRGRIGDGAVRTLSGDTIVVDFNQNTVSMNGNRAHIVETRGDTFIIDRVLY